MLSGGNMGNLVFAALLILAGGMSHLSATAQDKKDEKKEIQYTGVLIGTGGSIGGASSWIDMYIKKFTSNEEALDLLKILKEKGQDALQKELYKRDVGSIVTSKRTTTTGGFVNVAVARSIKSETGTIIRLFTARPMSFLELHSGGRSTDYPFGLIELMLDKDGNGQGAVIAAAKIKITEEGNLELESLGNQYLKITNVRRLD